MSFLGISEEFPLFLPRQNGRGSSEDEGNELSKSVGSNLGFSSMESPRIETVESAASLVNYGASSGARESYPDVQKGIKLLRRSVGCLCAYGFGHLSFSVPSDMAIFDAFAELLNTLSSKEVRLRSVLLFWIFTPFQFHTSVTAQFSVPAGI